MVARPRSVAVRALALGCVLAWLSLSPAQVGAQSADRLSPSETRDVAAALLDQGDVKRSIALSSLLLERDPDDVTALLIRARGYEALGDFSRSRNDLAAAFAITPTREEKARLALQAARMAYAGGAFTSAQIWLRRAAIHAPDEEFRANLARDYAHVRAVNPLNVRLRFAATPSDNVNNGADTPFLTIDGLPSVGVLSPDAQALSGQIFTSQVALRYGIARTDKGRSDIGLTYMRRDVRLSEEARTLAPTAENSDFGSSIAQLDISHAQGFTMGEDPLVGYGRLRYAKARAGGEDAFDAIGVDTRLQSASDTPLTPYLTLSFERRDDASGSVNDSDEVTLGTGITHRISNSLSYGLSLTHAERKSDGANRSLSETTMNASVDAGGLVDWVDLSASLTISWTEYPGYSLAGTLVPGGRQDQSTVVEVRGVFSDVTYAGFAPAASLTMGRRASNVSRFETEETSLGLEIVSSF